MNKMMGNKKVIALFTLPTLALFTLIVFYPILQTVYRSFFDWNGLTTPIFTGLENYKKLFTDDLFYESMKNGLIFAAILVVFQVGLATIFTMILMNPRVRGKRFFRSAYFIPAVLSVTVVCQLWGALYNPEWGLFNKIYEVCHCCSCFCECMAVCRLSTLYHLFQCKINSGRIYGSSKN